MVNDPLKKKLSAFDAKVKSSKGTTGVKKIKILLDAAAIRKGV